MEEKASKGREDKKALHKRVDCQYNHETRAHDKDELSMKHTSARSPPESSQGKILHRKFVPVETKREPVERIHPSEIVLIGLSWLNASCGSKNKIAANKGRTHLQVIEITKTLHMATFMLLPYKF